MYIYIYKLYLIYIPIKENRSHDILAAGFVLKVNPQGVSPKPTGGSPPSNLFGSKRTMTKSACSANQAMTPRCGNISGEVQLVVQRLTYGKTC